MAARQGHVEVVRYLGDEIDDINIIKDMDGVSVCECRLVCLVQLKNASTRCSCSQMCMSHLFPKLDTFCINRSFTGLMLCMFQIQSNTDCASYFQHP